MSTPSADGSSSTAPCRRASQRDGTGVLVVTVGTRGDVQPFVALCAGLLSIGYRVGIVTYSPFAGFIRDKLGKDMSVDFFGLDGDLGTVFKMSEFIDALNHGSVSDQMAVIDKHTRPYVESNLQKIYSAAIQFEAGAIVTGITQQTECRAIGQCLQIPVIVGAVTPYYPTAEFASPVFAPTRTSVIPFKNKQTYKDGFNQFWEHAAPIYNKFRQEVCQLPAQADLDIDGVPWLHMYSEHVGPRPKDWPPHVEITGYWDLDQALGMLHGTSVGDKGVGDEDYNPPEALQTFLDAGSPPVYFGFSVPLANMRAYAQAFGVALARLNMRGVYAPGAAYDAEDALADNPNVYTLLHPIPHTYLFPRCLAAIHHGGAGTTAAALTAGIPTLPFPVFEGEMHYWAGRSCELQVGPPRYFTAQEITADVLEKQLQEGITDETVSRARNMSVSLAAENGVAKACDIIDNYISHHSNTGRVYIRLTEEESRTCRVCQGDTSGPYEQRIFCASCGIVMCATCAGKPREWINYGNPVHVCRVCLAASAKVLTHIQDADNG